MKRWICLVLVLAMLTAALAGCSRPAGEEEIGLSSDVSAVSADAEEITINISLTGMTWADALTEESFSPDCAFGDMAVEGVERLSDREAALSLKGTVSPNNAQGLVYIRNEAMVLPSQMAQPSETDPEAAEEKPAESEYAAALSIRVLQPSFEVAPADAGTDIAQLTVQLSDAVFAQQLSPEFFRLTDGEALPAIAAVQRNGDALCTLTFAGAPGDVFPALSGASLVLEPEALTSGSPLSRPMFFYDSTLSATVDYLRQEEDVWTADLLVTAANGTVGDLAPEDFVLSGALEEILSVERRDERTLLVQAALSGVEEDGSITSFRGELGIPGVWGSNFWGEEKEAASVPVSCHKGAGDKELLAVDTGMAFDLLKAGLKSLALGIGTHACSRLFEAIDPEKFGDQTAQELERLNDLLNNMGGQWELSFSQVKTQLSIISDKIGQSNCGRILDNYDALTGELKATVLHLQQKKNAVDTAEKGTLQYEKAAAEYIRAVEQETCKVYTEAFVLGEALMKGSAGLTHGVIGAYDEMLSLMYNFDTQTYEMKKSFRVSALALYMEAYDDAVLYYQLTEPDNALLHRLESQLVTLSAFVDDASVVERDDRRIYIYASGTETASTLASISYDGNYTVSYAPNLEGYHFQSAVTNEQIIQMCTRAADRGTTLFQDISDAGFTRNGQYTLLERIWTDFKEYSHKSTWNREFKTTYTVTDAKTNQTTRDKVLFEAREHYTIFGFEWVDDYREWHGFDSDISAYAFVPPTKNPFASTYPIP